MNRGAVAGVAADVRSGSKPVFQRCHRDVAFSSNSDQMADVGRLRLGARALNRCAIVRQAACLKSTLTSAKDLNDEPL